ncbi:MAG: TIGR03032 family protein [Methylotenera sp.]|nr:TIGR03032 family protein [Methylotenera sp.]
MAEQKVSLAFSTYHANRVFFLGLSPKGEINMTMQTFPRVMGLWASADAQTLYMSHLFQILRFETLPDQEYLKKGVDRMYVPRHAFTTGDSDIHDIAANKHGLPVFVNTLYSCLATASTQYSFEPIWKPNFISKLAPEDRCHLNGLAMLDGNPKYVTCVAKSDVTDGWREHRSDGGLVIDVTTDDEVAGGLAMPHSPRCYNGKLYVHNSGRGEFGYVDLKAGKFEPIAFCPGYLRGLSFVGHYAVLGMSLSRHNINFKGLPLDDALKNHHAEARCGIQVVDLNTGDVVHNIRLGGVVQELYDVVTLANTRNPIALNFNKSDLAKMLNPPPPRDGV